MEKIEEEAVVYPCQACPGNWVVEAVDWLGDGGVFTTVFAGPDAESRAVEYAQMKFREFRQHAPRPQPYLAYRADAGGRSDSAPSHGATLHLVK